MTAKVDPVTAIHTTETALGTRVSSEGKCSFAYHKSRISETNLSVSISVLTKRKPKAEDFIEVSIAIVRQVVSSKPIILGRKKPKTPPSKCSRSTGIYQR